MKIENKVVKIAVAATIALGSAAIPSAVAVASPSVEALPMKRCDTPTYDGPHSDTEYDGFYCDEAILDPSEVTDLRPH